MSSGKNRADIKYMDQVKGSYSIGSGVYVLK
jgi:hypothetical protein